MRKEETHNSPSKEICYRCKAVDQEKHPLHGFEVRLEKTEYKGETILLCQRCKIQVDIKKKQLRDAGHSGPSNIKNLLSKIFGSN